MKKLIYTLSVCFFLLLFVNCKQDSSVSNVAIPSPDLKGFTTTKIANNTGEKVLRKDANGNIAEEGMLVNGAKTGSWVTYYPNKEKSIQTLANYVNNELNGVYLTFNNRGQIETLTTYANGVYDGYFVKYKSGNMEESGVFVNGKIEGLFKKFYQNNKIQVEANYKDGLQHGNYKYYDMEGNVTMEFEYENGDKVSGGIKK